MRLDDDQMLLILMALVPVPEGYRMNQLRERFHKADKPHTEFDIEAEYRFQSANAITARWLKATRGTPERIRNLIDQL